ncbi:DUF1345 domain-containing protein [Diaminobutyricibacter sp. McL0618]|uniref:DUF1345 domain-containing protein n=1 Tax=Leifsonia sp. McL0618 TaxID=3415677 RepID=UPI003CE8841D
MTPASEFGHWHDTRLRLLLMAVVGVAVGIIVSVTVGAEYGITSGWAAACVVYISSAWISVARLDDKQAERYATREDPNRAVAEVLILIAGVGSIVAVILLLGGAKNAPGAAKAIIPILGLLSVALSWFLIHTLFTLRYASLYYSGTNGGIDFNEDEPPNYLDFAYVSFTLGMTYQVSDTDLKTRAIRATALRQGLLSYLFGAVILASAVNLVAGLAQ